MRILLTGGFGFIGRRFIEKFPNLDNLMILTSKSLENRNEKIFQQIKIEAGHIEKSSILSIFRKYNPDIVIHLAALSGLSECEKNPLDAFKVNVLGTFNVTRACLKTNSKLIFVSSREVYGETTQGKSKENDPLLPKNVYGITKMLAESLVTLAGQNDKLDYTIYRITNAYGPGGTNGINKIIKTALNEKKIIVNGGEQIFNLIYVDDVVDAIKLAINDKKASRQIFNLGSADTTSLKELCENIARLIKFDIKFEVKPKPEFENVRFNPDNSKIKNLLGFSALTNLDAGLKKTIKWFEQNK